MSDRRGPAQCTASAGRRRRARPAPGLLARCPASRPGGPRPPSSCWSSLLLGRRPDRAAAAEHRAQRGLVPAERSCRSETTELTDEEQALQQDVDEYSAPDAAGAARPAARHGARRRPGLPRARRHGARRARPRPRAAAATAADRRPRQSRRPRRPPRPHAPAPARPAPTPSGPSSPRARDPRDPAPRRQTAPPTPRPATPRRPADPAPPAIPGPARPRPPAAAAARPPPRRAGRQPARGPRRRRGPPAPAGAAARPAQAPAAAGQRRADAGAAARSWSGCSRSRPSTPTPTPPRPTSTATSAVRRRRRARRDHRPQRRRAGHHRGRVRHHRRPLRCSRPSRRKVAGRARSRPRRCSPRSSAATPTTLAQQAVAPPSRRYTVLAHRQTPQVWNQIKDLQAARSPTKAAGPSNGAPGQRAGRGPRSEPHHQAGLPQRRPRRRDTRLRQRRRQQGARRPGAAARQAADRPGRQDHLRPVRRPPGPHRGHPGDARRARLRRRADHRPGHPVGRAAAPSPTR